MGTDDEEIVEFGWWLPVTSRLTMQREAHAARSVDREQRLFGHEKQKAIRELEKSGGYDQELAATDPSALVAEAELFGVRPGGDWDDVNERAAILEFAGGEERSRAEELAGCSAGTAPPQEEQLELRERLVRELGPVCGSPLSDTLATDALGSYDASHRSVLADLPSSKLSLELVRAHILSLGLGLTDVQLGYATRAVFLALLDGQRKEGEPWLFG